MKTTTYTGLYDGGIVRLDEVLDLPPNTPVLVTVLPPRPPDEDEEWHRLAASGLAAAYGTNEPDYSLSLLKEENPHYAGK
jgi:hypothetical protein